MLLKRLKKILLSIIISSVVLSFNIENKNTYAQENYNKEDVVIALDAAHFIDCPGKRSPNGKQEVQYSNDVIKRVETILKQTNPNIKIYKTNEDLNNKQIKGRSINAKRHNVDFLLSLHMDAASDNWNNDISGCHIIVDKDSRENTVKYLAKKLVKDYSLGTGIKMRMNNGYDERNDLSLLDECTNLGIDSMLLEMDFMSNENTYNNFNNEDYLNNVARTISDSLSKNVIPYLEKYNKINVAKVEQNQYIKCKIGS